MPSAARARVPRDWRLLISLLLGVAAVVALALGWFMVSGEDNIYAQLPYFFSFGGTALALMLAGVALFVDYEHSCDRRGITLLLERLEQIEIQLGVHDDTSLQGTSTR